MPSKRKTFDQLVATKEKAARFVRDVLGDEDRADEIEDEDPLDYAERKGLTLLNPTRRTTMARPTRADLEARIEELEGENQELNERLDSIAELSCANDNEEEEDEEEED